MAIFTKIIAFFSFIISLLSGMVITPSTPVTPKNNETIMFISDFQGTNRESAFTSIINKMDSEPGLIVAGGDYQSTVGVAGASDFGIENLKSIVNNKWANNNIQYLFVQGNHDPASTRSLNKTGLYKFDSYLIYLINEDDYPYSQGVSVTKKNTVKNTADKLNTTLTELVGAGETRPVFIVTHVPLHYSSRSSSKDNAFAGYVFDVVNKNAENLDITFLFGHNHSGTYDDYIGGSVNYIGKGNTMQIGGTNEAKTINFTYLNCGYIGYSNNSNSGSSTNALSATTITISDNYIEIQKHTASGNYYDNSIIVPRNMSSLKAAA